MRNDLNINACFYPRLVLSRPELGAWPSAGAEREGRKAVINCSSITHRSSIPHHLQSSILITYQ